MKNLKMFAIAVMAFAVMAMGVRAVSCDGVALLNEKCEGTLGAALADAKDGDTIKLLKVSDWSGSDGNSDITINKDITLDLDTKSIKVHAGNKLVIASGADVTIKGSGTIKNDASATDLIEVEAGATLKVEGSVKLVHTSSSTTPTSDKTSAILVAANDDEDLKTAVTIGKDVTVTSNNYGLSVGANGTLTSAINTTVELNGTWTTEGYVAKVNGQITYNENAPVMNVNAGTYTSNHATALYASGYGVWTIKGATVTGAQAIMVKSGKVSVDGGTYVATGTNTYGDNDAGTYAINIAVPTSPVAGTQFYAKNVDVKISGGEFTAKNDGSYAINIDGVTEDSKLAILGGKYTSGKDTNGKLLPAMNIANLTKTFLDEHKNMISGGEFVNGLIGEKKFGIETYSDDDFIKALSSVEFKVEENGNVVVGAGAGAGANGSEGQTPGEPGTPEPGDQTTGDGNQGPTDNVKNPDTNDNILVYAGLGLVSLASVAFTARKRED